MSKLFRIAIDGPGASGKSNSKLDTPKPSYLLFFFLGTTAKLLAKKLGFGYIDSGAMYRAVMYFQLS